MDVAIFRHNGVTYVDEPHEQAPKRAKILSAMTTKEMLEIYNNVAADLEEPAREKFVGKPQARKQTLAILGRFRDSKRKTSRVGGESAGKAMSFIYPYKGDEFLKKLRDKDSLRGQIHGMLEKGATFVECVERVKKFDKARGGEHVNEERRAYEAIRLLHFYVGYGLKQDEKGRIFVHTDKK